MRTSSCLPRSVHVPDPRQVGAERIRQGEGRLSHPPKTALERSYLTGVSSSENRILLLSEAETEKNSWANPRKIIIILIYI